MPRLETCSLASGSVPCISRGGLCSGRFGTACLTWSGGHCFLFCFLFPFYCPVSFFDQKLRKGKTDSECVNDRVFWVFFVFF